MPKYLRVGIAAAMVCAALSSCGVTKHIADGDFLLTHNTIVEDKSAPKEERVKKEDLERFIQPQANRRFLGTNLYIRLYNMASADTTKRNWFNRTLRKLGEAPVLLDTSLVSQSSVYMRNYVVYSGFYNSAVEVSVDTSRKKKARVTYTVRQGRPYRIGEIDYEFRDDFLRPIILRDSTSSLLRSGAVLDGNTLSAERSRIFRELRNNGYYKFNLNSIEFLGDSTAGDYKVDLTMVVKQHLADYTPQGEPVYENNSIYRISSVSVDPEYSPMAATDSSYFANMDTLSYRGLDIVYPRGGKPRVKRKVLRQAINLYPNYIYNADQVQQTATDILGLGFYKNASIVFRDDPADSTAAGEVTFIGGDETSETTTERYMSCHINLIPALKQSYKIELEGTTSSNFYAINATVGYQNRNLFRGSELFDVSLKGGYEFMRSKGKKSSFEIGGSTSVTFPRFLTPFRVDRFNKTTNPRTKVEVAVSTQRRPYYHRVLSSGNWGYAWGNGKGSSYTFRPIDLNLIKMNSVDPEFLESLYNDYLKSSYQEQLAAGFSGSYVFNSQIRNPGAKYFLLRFNWETAGNLLNLMSHAFSSSRYTDSEGEEYYKVFGIHYSQYVRFDLSLSNRIFLGARTNIAWRLYGGAGFSYGNSVSIPYDRLFYSGGSNSMRGWVSRTLGPGNVIPTDTRYNNQVGNMKLEANAELRFPVWGMLHGAVFMDVGNVWYFKETSSVDEEGIFKIDRFYRQLGLNTGLGFRFDIGMVVIRFDWGMRVHDPNEVKGERWRWKNGFKFSDTVLNFGVGYPF